MTRFFNRSTETEKRRQLRKDMSPAEGLLWSKLKGRKLLGCKFRRQFSVGAYVIDFYCPELKLAIELDGESHSCDGAKEYDKQRDAFIASFGIRFLRFLNTDVRENLEGVWDAIVREVGVLRDEMKRRH